MSNYLQVWFIQPCLVKGLENGNCTLTAISECMCTNITVQAELSECVQISCPFKDQAVASVLSNQICVGYPIESRAQQVKAAAIACAAVAFPIVILRCVARLMVTKRLWWDDWTALVATVFLIALLVLQTQSTDLGFGLHFWNVDVANAKTIFQIFYATQILYILIQVSAKASLLAFYSRVFTSRTFRIAVWSAAAFLIGHGLIFLGLVIFQCTPIASVWNRNLKSKCLNLTAIGYAGAVFSIVEDIAILILPIPELLKLQLGGRKKAALLFMFSIGSFACVTSMVRLKYLVSFASTLDATWDNVYVVIWSMIELSCALICASLPALRPLIQMLPGVLSTARGSSVKHTTDTSRRNVNTHPSVSARIEDLRRTKGEMSNHGKMGDAYLDIEPSSRGGSYELQTVASERRMV
ncbi:CFEM domain-containing protein [Fusarium keratoplasticum]|uniref:CFEM domain-containing protein n=1 Tax=Fusarium keratoplasticum TaxID=1328300 RepID=A0ACC0QUH7_9HYPO|nr:CFEM domain-containing protein [Fusarium keratoplasticum]KAI8668651.1 CFEM domain-containing protein [Fusarium keratoplasticum]